MAAAPTALAVTTRRDPAFDVLRGFIMVAMALDHANLFVGHSHSPGEHWFAPLPHYESAAAFLTRLITHPAAPGFFFLMGVGMVFFASSRRSRGWSEGRLIAHFAARGAVLILLQFTLVNLAWSTGPNEQPTFYLGVLGALGGTMIFAGFLIRMRPSVLALLSVVTFIGIELTHPGTSDGVALFDQPLGLVLGYSGGDMTFWSNYPVLVWLELVLFGMAFGKWWAADRARATKLAGWLGVVFFAAFAFIRALDGFGNVRPQDGEGWIGFFNVVKYPPAMTFTLLAMGVNLVVLAAVSRRSGDGLVMRTIAVYGRVPLFFYLAHLYLYSALGAVFTPEGTGLGVMYLLWLVGLALLYPASRWYGKVKSSHPSSLLRFL